MFNRVCACVGDMEVHAPSTHSNQWPDFTFASIWLFVEQAPDASVVVMENCCPRATDAANKRSGISLM
jgi:hypothetical protein